MMRLAYLCIVCVVAAVLSIDAAMAHTPKQATTSIESPADSELLKRGRYIEKVKIASLVGEAGMKSFAPFLDADHEIEFDVFAPKTYHPSRPAGLMVFVSPTPTGKIPNRWKRIIIDRNLIWVSVNKSGNNISLYRRMIEASVSPAFMAKTYKIDPSRIYIAGFSGGGRISSLTATFYPQLFNGAIYMSGVDPWGVNPPALMPLIKNNRFVFVTGSNDFNLHETREVFHAYEEAGIEQIKLMVINNLAHDLPGAEKLDEAVAFLDSGKGLASAP